MLSLFLLLPLYSLWVQHERGGNWSYLKWLGVIAGPVDLVLNYTELAILTGDLPRKGEWTFSKRLSRLSRTTGKRGAFGRYCKLVLDAIAPSGLHIK